MPSPSPVMRWFLWPRLLNLVIFIAGRGNRSSEQKEGTQEGKSAAAR
jgi:hypothetical protein